MRGGSSPKKGGQAALALGRSRGGFSTKIHVSVDGLGNPLRFILTGGQQHDITQAEGLIAGYAGEHVLADRYDEAHLHILALACMMPVIPPRRTARNPPTMTGIWNASLKHYGRIFSRFEKAGHQIPGLPALHRRSHLVTVKCQQNLVLQSQIIGSKGHYPVRGCGGDGA